MIDILRTRFIHWKKQWLTLLFWLLFPAIGTIIVINLTAIIQDDSKVPVGIVLEEQTPLAMELYDHIKQSPLIRVYDLTEKEAIHRLEKHELDSAFIIQDGYENQIQKGSRNGLITSYQSDLSFAFSPVKEMIVSYIQQDTGRSKAAYTVQDLSRTYQSDQQWTWEEVVVKSKEIQTDENLLRTAFTFANASPTTDNNEFIIWNSWGLWALFSLLATLLLFDWLIKENRLTLLPRFAFMRFSFKNYILQTGLFYTILFVLFDLLTVAAFYYVLDEPVDMQLVGAILFYRIMLNAGAFVTALCFRNLYLFYSVSFTLALLFTIVSGAVIPTKGITDRVPWLELLNPLHPFLQKEIGILWMVIFAVMIIIWYFKKEDSNA